MNNEQKKAGFSLTEVLLAIGTLAIGMVFIAGTFPVAIHFTTVATERTIAAVAADEAFAKIRLYAVGDLINPLDDIELSELEENELKPDEFTDFNDIFPAMVDVNSDEFTYPSTGTARKQYYWSALCRRAGDDPDRLVQVTVFISRKVSPNLKYPDPDGSGTVDWPMPVKVEVSKVSGNELRIETSQEKTFINDGYTIVDNRTGRLYRVLERYRDMEDDIILLDRDWEGSPEEVWVVPPPKGGGRGPGIAVYQKVIRF